MKTDIRHRADLEILLTKFYQRLLADPLLAPIFIEVAKIDLLTHLPILCDFWESILFYTAVYRSNAMLPHLKLHDQVTLTNAHFERWLGHFEETIDELFEGEKAELAKSRAKSIGGLMRVKMEIEDV